MVSNESRTHKSYIFLIMLLAISSLYKDIFVIKRLMRCNSKRKNQKSLPFMSSMICVVHLFTILMTVSTKYIFELNFLLKIRRCSIDRNVYGATVRLKCQCYHCFYLSHFVCNKEMILYRKKKKKNFLPQKKKKKKKKS